MVFPEQISLSPRCGGSPLGQKQWLRSTLSPVASISQTRRDFYLADGKQAVAGKKKKGSTPTAHDSSTWYVPEIRENDGYERIRRGREREKKVFWPVSRGKGSFLSSDLLVQPREKCKQHQVLPLQREKAGSKAALPFLSLCVPPASAWPEAGGCPELPLWPGLRRTAVVWWWLHHVGNQKYFCLRHHGKLSRNQFSCIRYITWMPHIPFGNSLKYWKLLDKGTPNSLDLAQHSPGLNLDLHSWPAAPSAGKEASLSPPLLPPSPSCPQTEGVLDRSSLRVRECSSGITSSAWGALLVLLFSMHQEKISAGMLFCWNQNTSQNPADFTRISLKKKIRKTKSSSGVGTFFSMFEMQHSCAFFIIISKLLSF